MNPTVRLEGGPLVARLAVLVALVPTVLSHCAWVQDTEATRQKVTTLCEELARLHDGESAQVELTGVYAAGYEISAFYDPEQPLCPEDFQPSTWAELSAVGGQSQKLRELVRLHRRALVKVRGVLQGPPPAGQDDESLPIIVAYANRSAGRRFGHLGMFRTKLTITEVVSAEELPASQETRVIHTRPLQEGKAPAPVSAELPKYPPLAWNLGLAGVVRVEVTVSKGMVVCTRLLSGDRLLAAGAEGDIKSWRFPETTNAVFSTTFTYELERRPSGANRGTTHILDLPATVTLRAPLDLW